MKKFLSIILFILLLPGVCFGAWPASNTKRKQFVVAENGASGQYPIPITVNYGSGSDSGNTVYLAGSCGVDFGDIRFTESDGITELDYWIESSTSSTAALIWVESPTLDASGNTNLYIYYGNVSATTTSDGTETFLAFTSFDEWDGSEEQTAMFSPIPKGDSGQWDDARIVGGWIRKLNSVYYIFYIGADADDGSFDGTGIATSTDGFHWYRAGNASSACPSASNPVFVADAGGWESNSYRGITVLTDEDGITPIQYDSKYWATFHTYTSGGGIGLLSAPTLCGPWTRENSGNRIISPGAGGTWDDDGVKDYSFILSGSTYYIFYAGDDGSSNICVGYATAATPDGAWTKYGSNPVLCTPGGEWDDTRVDDCIVKKIGSTWYLFYTGDDSSGQENGWATASEANFPNTWTRQGQLNPGSQNYSFPMHVDLGDGYQYIYGDNHQTNMREKGLMRSSAIDSNFTYYQKSNWIVGSGGGSSKVSINNGIGTIYGSTTVGTYPETSVTRTRNAAIRARINWIDHGSGDIEYIGFLQSGGQPYCLVGGDVGNDDIKLRCKVGSDEEEAVLIDTVSDEFGIVDLKWLTNAVGCWNGSCQTLSTYIPSTALPVEWAAYTSNETMSADWILLRPYVSSEPSVSSWGAEESSGGGGSFLLFFF